MKAGNYGNLLVQIEQPRGEYAVTIAFLRLITTLVKVMFFFLLNLLFPDKHSVAAAGQNHYLKKKIYCIYVFFFFSIISGSAWQHSEQRPDPLCAAGVEGDAAHLPQVALQHLWRSREDR